MPLLSDKQFSHHQTVTCRFVWPVVHTYVLNQCSFLYLISTVHTKGFYWRLTKHDFVLNFQPIKIFKQFTFSPQINSFFLCCLLLDLHCKPYKTFSKIQGRNTTPSG